MTKAKLIREIKKALKEHENFYAGAGIESYDSSTIEGWTACLLSISLDYLKGGEK